MGTSNDQSKTPVQQFEGQEGTIHAKTDNIQGYGEWVSQTAMNVFSASSLPVSNIGMDAQRTAGSGLQGTIYEISTAINQIAGRASEAKQAFSDLFNGLNCIANASQAIADTFGTTDLNNAVSIGAVGYMFGDPGAARPSQMPSSIKNTTILDQQMAAQNNNQTPMAAGVDPSNPAGTPGAVRTESRSGVVTYTYPDGSSVTVSPDGGTVSMWGAPDKNGQVQPLGATTTTTSTYVDPKTGQTIKRTVTDQTQTTTDSDGKPVTTDTTTTQDQDPEGNVDVTIDPHTKGVAPITEHVNSPGSVPTKKSNDPVTRELNSGGQPYGDNEYAPIVG